MSAVTDKSCGATSTKASAYAVMTVVRSDLASVAFAAAAGNSAAAAKATDAKSDRTTVITAYADALVDVAPQLLSVTADISSDDAQAITQVVERLARYPGMRLKG